MVLIILGLYFFLWAKKNETSRSPQTNVAAGELSTSMAIDESFQAQSTGVVTPISSLPNKSVHLEIEKS
jgi:secreted protein with Ig-like and vWFA domain